MSAPNPECPPPPERLAIAARIAEVRAEKVGRAEVERLGIGGGIGGRRADGLELTWQDVRAGPGPSIRVCRDWGPTGWRLPLSCWRRAIRRYGEED